MSMQKANNPLVNEKGIWIDTKGQKDQVAFIHIRGSAYSLYANAKSKLK